MSKSFTPGLKVLRNFKLLKKRILPLKGIVHVKKGEKLKSEDIVASTKIPGNIQMVNVSKELNIEPLDIQDSMLISIDKEVKKNQVIAETKGLFGLFKSEVRTPITGIISNISNVTGQVVISEPPIPIEIDAYIDGEVIEIISNEGISIESFGTYIQGIIGFGQEIKGEVIVISENANDQISSTDIKDIYKDKIIVGGAHLTLNAYLKAKEIGIKGIVTGGFDFNDIAKILGKPLGVAITGGESVGPTIVITEGFGRIQIAESTYDILNDCSGKIASMNGATQIRAGVMRPEIFISSSIEDNSKHQYFESELAISIGSKVRITRAPYFGKVGHVISLPHELSQLESGASVRIAEIQIINGSNIFVPRANLEVILTD
jgi:hypothetical protein